MKQKIPPTPQIGNGKNEKSQSIGSNIRREDNAHTQRNGSASYVSQS